MANLVELSKMAENMPDQQLVQAAQGQGSLPAYVAITEVKRRADLRKAYDAQVAQAEMPQATVSEQLISEYVQPGLQGMASERQGFQSGGRIGFQEGESTAFSIKDLSEFRGRRNKPYKTDMIDEYLRAAGINPEGLSQREKIRYVRDLQRQVIKPQTSADPISKSATTIDPSIDDVPPVIDKDQPMPDQPKVESLSDFTQVMDIINAPLDVKSTPIKTPQSVEDLRKRVQERASKSIEGLQAIDIPIKSAEEKQNEREVSALSDMAIAISDAKNLGDIGVGLGQAAKGVQAIKDKQEAKTLDARLKQRELQRQDIEFIRAQEADVDESLNKLAGLDVKLQEAQTLQDDKAYERAFNEKKAMITALNDVDKLKIYQAQIQATNNKAKIDEGRQLITLYNTLTTQLKDAISDEERAAIQGQMRAVLSKIDSELTQSALGNIGANEVGMTEFFNE